MSGLEKRYPEIKEVLCTISHSRGEGAYFKTSKQIKQTALIKESQGIAIPFVSGTCQSPTIREGKRNDAGQSGGKVGSLRRAF